MVLAHGIADAPFTITAPRRRPPSSYQPPPHCYEGQIEGQTDGFEGDLPYHTPTDATLRRQDERKIDRREALVHRSKKATRIIRSREKLMGKAHAKAHVNSSQ